MKRLGSPSMNWAAAAALLLFWAGGCNSSSSPKCGISPSSSPAAKSWDNLEGQARTSEIVGMVVKSDATKYFTEQVKKAKQEASIAMQGSLPVDALDAMVDEIAQNMARELPNVEEVKNSKNQLVLAFSSISDATGSNNVQLQSALQSLRNRLMKSEKMNDNFIFVSTSEAQADKLRDQIAGNDLSAFRDPLQRTPDKTKADKYDPQSIFLISGRLDSSKNDVCHTVKVKLALDLVHVLSRRSIPLGGKSGEFIRTYMWNPDKSEWEVQP